MGNEPIKMTRNQAAEYIKECEKEEATWTQYKMYDFTIAVRPNGSCYIYEYCNNFPNIRFTMEFLCRENVNSYERGYRLYSDIVNDIDTGKYTYNEHFTKEYIDSKRNSLPLYPIWIRLSHERKLPINCENCLKTNWISIDDIHDLGNIKHECPNCEAYCGVRF